MAEGSAYVTNHAWVRTLARPDTIDEIADAFERTVPDAAAPAVAADPARHWPRHSRGWLPIARLQPDAALRETA